MPMTDTVASDFRETLQEIENAGTYNEERVLLRGDDALFVVGAGVLDFL